MSAKSEMIPVALGLLTSIAFAAPASAPKRPPAHFKTDSFSVMMNPSGRNVAPTVGYDKRGFTLAPGVWYELYDPAAKKGLRGGSLETKDWTYAATPKGARVAFDRQLAHGPATNRVELGAVHTEIEFADKTIRVVTTATPAKPGAYSFQPQPFSQEVYFSSDTWRYGNANTIYRSGARCHSRIEPKETFTPGSWCLSTSQRGPEVVEVGYLDMIMKMTAGKHAGFHIQRWPGTFEFSCSYEKTDLMYPEPWTQPVTWEFTIGFQ